MGFRCELCDAFLPVIQLSRLCPTCYTIRTIVKCYEADKILDCLNKNFKVDYEIVEEKLDDGTIIKYPKDVVDTGSKAETIQIKVEEPDEEAKDYEASCKEPVPIVSNSTLNPTSINPLPYSPVLTRMLSEGSLDKIKESLVPPSTETPIETRSKKNKSI